MYVQEKDDEVPLSYPLAFNLLETALGFCKIGQDDQDVRGLLNWIRIGNNAYSFHDIDSFLSDRTDFSAKVKHFISPFGFQLYFILQILEELINQMSGNGLKIKTQRRESMSIFDQVADTQEQIMVKFTFTNLKKSY